MGASSAPIMFDATSVICTQTQRRCTILSSSGCYHQNSHKLPVASKSFPSSFDFCQPSWSNSPVQNHSNDIEVGFCATGSRKLIHYSTLMERWHAACSASSKMKNGPQSRMNLRDWLYRPAANRVRKIDAMTQHNNTTPQQRQRLDHTDTGIY